MSARRIPGARKCVGGYKPIIAHPDGRTEVVGLRFRPADGGRDMRRASGRKLETRDEAIAYAQRVIDARAERASREATE
jgi:hypothetical protein